MSVHSCYTIIQPKGGGYASYLVFYLQIARGTGLALD